ncbi:MAG: nuclear transport factor 2 family protein [Maribacter sp.]
MKIIKILLIVISLNACNAPIEEKDDIAAIKEVLKAQEQAWSNNDLDGFMQGYLQSDSIPYFGSGGIVYGWQNMLDRYKKGYPTSAETGALKFTIANISKIDDNAYWVMGEYHLEREVGNANGTFMIIFKRIKGAWKIVGDHSC